MKQYYVYIMTNKSRTLYTGVTSDLGRRVYEHKRKLVPGFTSKYRITQLVYFEVTQDIYAAIAREKQIKGWLRGKKIALIESVNPEWKDLSIGWYEEGAGEATTTKRSATVSMTSECEGTRQGSTQSGCSWVWDSEGDRLILLASVGWLCYTVKAAPGGAGREIM